jgi:transcriptional regulator with XRE-family HTH domain
VKETFGQALRRYRGSRSQQNLATAVNVSAGYISDLELGRRRPHRDLAANLERALGADGALTHLVPTSGPNRSDALVSPDPAEAVVDSRVTRSHDQWRRVRAALNASRADLTQLAASLYPAGDALAGTGLIAPPAWIPDRPVDLADVHLAHDSAAPSPVLDGTEPASAHVRPLHTLARPYSRYTQAIRDLAHPRLFENRSAWRLLAVDQPGRGLRFGDTAFFAAVDVNEVLAHEMAYVSLDEDGRPVGAPHLRELPYRRLVGDPFDLARRPVIVAVSTLTIRAGAPPTFLLHRRDPRSVAMAGGMLQVIPSGIFQPSSVLPAAVHADFDLWRNLQREFAEELLGLDELDGGGQPIDYCAEPFAGLDRARARGGLRAYYLGVALDALTLVGEVLTVAVLDTEAFDELAGDIVDVNDEGSIVAERLEFTEPVLADLLASGRVAPAGAGCLRLAWKHRRALLGDDRAAGEALDA